MSSIDANPALSLSRSRTDMLRKTLLSRPSTVFAVVVIGIFTVVALFAPWIAPYDPLAQSFFKVNQYPSWEHWLGTDQFGRDVLSRIIHGSQNSLLFGVMAPTIAMVVGTTLGVVSGYFGGMVDRLVTRVIDMLLSFPELLFAIIVAAALGGGFWSVLLVMTVVFIPGFARVARSATLAVRQEPYIEAAVAMGIRTPLIIIRHVVPNMFASTMLMMTLWIASAIRLEATLSFLGIGTRPPEASWGNIIRDGLTNIFGSPWAIIGAGFSITLVVLAFNIIGDALRDAMDPESAE
ncbi:ABC transporter permease [Falsirhodobacter xinxiangensis]|uniref:ABC transporter permease n=1 Tax=Falsirhodobacter xinxiangensis TaxID=2530049 RepID=UPI001FEB70EB|nr:ABC transporter permease [Rhodobacter xinxiangensis]